MFKLFRLINYVHLDNQSHGIRIERQVLRRPERQ